MSRKQLHLTILCVLVIKSSLVFIVVPRLGKMYPTRYNINIFCDEYASIAENIAHGNGYRVNADTAKTMIRPPAYVLILAILFKLFGRNLFAAQIFNVICSLFAAYFVVLLSKKLLDSRRFSVLAGCIFLLHPGTILSETRGGIESLFTFLLAAFLYALFIATHTDKRQYYVMSGCILAALALVKSTVLAFPIFLVPYLVYSKGDNKWRRCHIKNVMLFLLAMFLVMCPWIIRNYLLVRTFLPTMTLAGSLAQEGLYATQNYGFSKNEYELGWSASRERALVATKLGMPFKKSWHLYFYNSEDELEFDRCLLTETLRKYWEQPSMLVKTVSLNAFRFWFRGRTAISDMLNFVATFPLLVLAVWGVYLGLKLRLQLGVIVLFVVYFFLVHLPLFAIARYHIPLLPLLVIISIIPFRFRGACKELLCGQAH